MLLFRNNFRLLDLIYRKPLFGLAYLVLLKSRLQSVGLVPGNSLGKIQNLNQSRMLHYNKTTMHSRSPMLDNFHGYLHISMDRPVLNQPYIDQIDQDDESIHR